jgi:hypothetical protein
LAALLDLLSARFGLLPQDLFDHLRLPAWVVQRVLQALRAGLGVLGSAEASA